MAIDIAKIKKQVIALLNINVRDAAGVPEWTDSIGDDAYLSEELDESIQNACLAVIQAICETDGHPQRYLFVTNTAVTHGSPLPTHFGTIGVPVITPFTAASFTINGVRKSYEDIDAFRRNPSNIYGAAAHNVATSGAADRKAGYFAIVNAHFYFTGFSATIPLASFNLTSIALLSEAYEPTIIKLAIGSNQKLGMESDICSYYQGLGNQDMALIRSGFQSVPSIDPLKGTKDRGTR
jgi:hypothetical protein